MTELSLTAKVIEAALSDRSTGLIAQVASRGLRCLLPAAPHLLLFFEGGSTRKRRGC